jgi:hypothetical protein
MKVKIFATGILVMIVLDFGVFPIIYGMGSKEMVEISLFFIKTFWTWIALWGVIAIWTWRE